MILSGAHASEVHERAVQGGMTSLRQDAAAKVAQGITTVEEVIRVTT
jgi:type II secretory ATPase GspE/PulE/Tfp pilus assembly ATPase PilB-like protein